MLEIGQLVEKYRVDRLLGEGGMAAVYQVTHSTLETQHALKVLTLGGKQLKQRLVAEGKVQAQLQHPNIVRVLDVVEVDGQPGLVMDYIDGPDLDEYIHTNKPGPAEAEAIFRGVLAGVGAAHALGLIHRDLKPANVLMAKQSDGSFVPKVADFGLVKAMAGSDTSTPWKTRTGMPMGTPPYMAPEQIRDAATVDERADLFSLGCILHELVAHERTYPGTDTVDIFNAVLEDQRIGLQELAPGAPKHLAETVDRCLATRADDRPESTSQVLALLDGSGPRRPRKPSHDAPTIAPTAVGIGLLIGLVVLTCAGVGLTSLVIGFSSTSEDPAPSAETTVGDCTGEGLLGFANVRMVIAPKKGTTWSPMASQEVYEDRPREENQWRTDWEVVCTLPAGTPVKLEEAPVRIRGAGHWIPITSTGLTPPED